MIRRFIHTRSQLPLARHGPIRRYSHSNSLLDELQSRGLVAQITRYFEETCLCCIMIYSLRFLSPELGKTLNKPITLYCGVDPTAPSLHVGNLVALMSVLHFHIHGHRVLPLVCICSNSLRTVLTESRTKGGRSYWSSWRPRWSHDRTRSHAGRSSLQQQNQNHHPTRAILPVWGQASQQVFKYSK